MQYNVHNDLSTHHIIQLELDFDLGTTKYPLCYIGFSYF